MSDRFSQLVMEGVLATPFIPRARETLEILEKNRMPAYIVSATTENEIRFIVENKGLLKYFQEIHGSPRKKWEICRDIITRNNYNNPNCLFIGDAMSDYKAAQKTGVRFLGIVKNIEVSSFPDDTHLSSNVILKLPS